MSRPQYTLAKCGACGKKKAYKVSGYFGSFTSYEVRCTACGAKQDFVYPVIKGADVPKWPGSLESAAALLKPR